MFRDSRPPEKVPSCIKKSRSCDQRCPLQPLKASDRSVVSFSGIAFGNHVIGILLTGYLDDGTASLKVIQECGGTVIVPRRCGISGMPINALNQLKPGHCLPIAEMGGLLYQLVNRKPPKKKAISEHVRIEAEIAKRIPSDLPAVNALSDQVPFICPGCVAFFGK